MPDAVFPLYRQLVNGHSLYRIDSPTAFLEVQRVGRRYLVHQVEARTYPEKVRIAGLIAMEDGHVVACSSAEFTAWLERATEGSQD